MATIIKITADGESHDFDVERMTFAEGRAFEQVTGEALADAFSSGRKPGLTAVQALLWIALKRSDTRLAFSDLNDRAIADFTLEQSEDGDAEAPADPTTGDDQG